MEFSKISSKLLGKTNAPCYPRSERVIGLMDKIKTAIFPGYFREIPQPPEAWLQSWLAQIHEELSYEIQSALTAGAGIGADARAAAHVADRISAGLIERLADIRQLLYKDAQAGYDGDPAAVSIDEVILTYPGFYAVFTYRIAHYLFTENVPFIPRMMSEHAHSVTGIDIHPGAQIGEYFFIDHGTGVVIGETSVIGNLVKLYQGVTVGALSVQKAHGFEKTKRHPTIKDNVTVYSGASILGGNTVIGENAVIGGNAFIVKSVPAGSVVKMHNYDVPDVWFYQI